MNHEIEGEITKKNLDIEHLRAINEREKNKMKNIEIIDNATKEEIEKLNNDLNNCVNKINMLEASFLRPQSKYFSNDNISEEMVAFKNYLRNGGIPSNFHTKSLNTINPSEGGYLVATEMSDKIIRLLNDYSVMRKLASQMTISANSIEIIEDRGFTGSAGWVQEIAHRDANDNVNFAKKIIHTFEIYAQPKASQRIIDDAMIDIGKWLEDKISETFKLAENKAFISGNGIDMPRGILTFPSGTNWGEIEQIPTINKGKITADDLLNMIFSLREEYSNRGSFLMNRTTLHAVRTLKTNQGEYIWNPSNSGNTDNIFGIPVYTSSEMPSYNMGGLLIAFADFKTAYQIIDRNEIRILRDPFTEKPFIKFYATKRVGGDVINSHAIKLLKMEK